MSETKPTIKEGRVSVPMAQAKLKEFSVIAKKNGTTKGALARTLILDGMERIKAGQLQVSAGVTLTPAQ